MTPQNELSHITGKLAAGATSSSFTLQVTDNARVTATKDVRIEVTP